MGESEKGIGAKIKAHVLVFPFPIQGHINPMLQFSKRLAYKGLKVTFIFTTFHSKFVKQLNPSTTKLINVELIDDGVPEGGEKSAPTHAAFKYLESKLSVSLSELIQKFSNSYEAPPVKCVVYDAMMPWVLDLAKEKGIDGAPFFTQSYAVNSIYQHIHEGRLTVPVEATPPSFVSLPSIPLLRSSDMPSFVTEDGMHIYGAVLKLLVDQFTNCGAAKFVFVNSFDALEIEVMNWMASQMPVKSIGPTIPTTFLDKPLEDDKNYGISLFKQNVESCVSWLDDIKEPRSVIYIAFGSLAALGEEQMLEIAHGVKNTKQKFLWVVRETEESKLPKNFKEETSEQGLIVTWCTQLDVLQHQAVGCFITHCGWNSTLEAISLGVPMVAMPQWTDQPTNAKYIQDVWGVGVQVKLNDKGIVTQQEIEHCVRQVTKGPRAEEIKRNINSWKKLAKEAVDQGGSSDKNINDFVHACSLAI